jgi:cytochrome P450
VTYLLSKRPQVQKKLREELRHNLPEDFRTNLTTLAESLEKLPYLNAICQETLRLYPPVPATMREAAKDTKILGNFIPKGTRLIISMWAINRSTQFWGENALEFIPERWITDGKPNNHGGSSSNYCNRTFLHGPRSCIGMGVARAELRCLVTAFILSFEWTLGMPEEDVIPADVVILKPKKGMRLHCRSIRNN